MWFASFQIENFKSFEDSGQHALSRGMNIIVGQNNAGKTALLQAVGDPRVVAAAHLSSKLARGQSYNPTSQVTLEICCTFGEFKNYLLAHNATVDIPATEAWASNPATALVRLESETELRVLARRVAQGRAQFNIGNAPYPSTSILIAGAAGPPNMSLRLGARPNRTSLTPPAMVGAQSDTIGSFLLGRALSKTYYFNAVRTTNSRWRHGAGTELSSNGENLAEVLNNLQANPSAYKRYLEKVRRVLPLVKYVSVRAVTPTEDEIFIWNMDESTEREDLAIPLSECGTGIGQVLAMIYVVMQSSGDILIIDEPNSFLHPRATRELMNIFRGDERHQYIISTHSAGVIVAARPEKLFMLTIENEQTKIAELDQMAISGAREVLEELGSRLSDVFGTDSVVWVEGPTEVDCFPLLLAAANKRLGTGISFVALRSTGDLEGKHADVVADIYRNISGASSLIPNNIAIILDGDKMGHARIAKLEKAFGIKVTFLARRTYENYLLYPQAIVSCLNNCETFKSSPLTEQKVLEALSRLGREARFGASNCEPFSDEWTEKVDAPNLLDNVFQELSNAKEIYRKLIHSSEITRWILNNKPEFLQPIIGLLMSTIGEGAVPN